MQHNATQEEISLTPRQLAALPHLAAAPTIVDGACAAGIDRTTVHRWMHDAAFRTELDRMRNQAFDLAVAELHGLMLNGVGVLARAMRSRDETVRLRAARATVSLALRANDSRDLLRRLDTLDGALARLKDMLR